MEVAEALLIPFFSVRSRYQEPIFQLRPCRISRKTGIPISMSHKILKRFKGLFEVINSIRTQDLLDISLTSCYHSGLVDIYFQKLSKKGVVDWCTAIGSVSVFLPATSW